MTLSNPLSPVLIIPRFYCTRHGLARDNWRFRCPSIPDSGEPQKVGDLVGHALMAGGGQMSEIRYRPFPAEYTCKEPLRHYSGAKRPGRLTLDARVLNVPRKGRQFQQNHRSIGTSYPFEKMSEILAKLLRRSWGEKVITANLQQDQSRVLPEPFGLLAGGGNGGSGFREANDLDGIAGSEHFGPSWFVGPSNARADGVTDDPQG